MTQSANHRIDPADIAQAQAVSVARIAFERRLPLKKAGGELIGPCPRCGGRDRFAVNVANLFNCRGCDGAGAGAISFVMWLDDVGFRQAVETLTGRAPHQVDRPAVNLGPGPAPRPPDDHDRRQHEKAAWLWSRRRPITGSIAEVYLRARGITCPLPGTLAFLPALKVGHFPAMIASFGLCDEVEPGIIAAPGEVQAVHLTMLEVDGSGKAEVEPNKIMIGSPSGRPIVLAPANDLLGLAITEGIEDALSVHEALGLGAWAAGAAGFMPKLADTVPSYIECVTIYADDDADHQGERNASRLFNRLHERGIEAIIEGLVP
ncbi:toprim domain-containing protein [Bradyrhizobium sp. RT4b]|uniref:DUF7146 domain-containing protein n=1 Tax=Bradyrhizobium sp. RT4b TaxID=3156379 RepID=UPI003390AF0F